MAKKDKNNQNINSIPKYQWGNYFKKPIKWLAHQINNYGNSKQPFITTGTSYAYALADEKKKHPKLTEQQIQGIVNLRIKQNRKKLGLPTNNTPSQAAAGLALGSFYYPLLAIPDIIFDTAASIDEPSTSNNLHTIADFSEIVAKITPSKIDDYIAKGVQTLGNIDDAVSTSGRNMFSIFDKKSRKINNTIDKTSVRESTNIKYRKNGGQVRKMQTASGGPLVNESTRVEKPIITVPKKINKVQLSDDNLWEKTDNNNEVNVYPNLRDDKYIQEFFQYDYAPRFKRQNNFALQDYVNAAKNIYKNTPINVYNKNGSVGGYQTGGERRIYNNYLASLINSSYVSPSIYLNENYKMNRPTLVHELTHAFRQGYLGITGDTRFSSAKRPLYSVTNNKIGNEYSGSGYSNSEKNILNNTYNMKGYEIDYDPLFEKGTTNTEVRFRLWKQLYDKLGRRPSLEETDEYIKTYDGEKLQKIIRNANGYGRTMYNNGMLINQIKNALINVAQNNNNNDYQLNDQTYYAKQGGKIDMIDFLKKGSGIHIKKENRGKFTDYCGGKVTSECIARGKSSSNPAIRKRATFAANARKWKHQKGGILQFLQQGNKIDWAGIIGNFASQALQTYAQNKQIQAQADQQIEANNAQKVSPMEYVSKYFQEIMDEENRRNEAMKAITGTTINSSDIVGRFFAHQRGKQEAFAHNKEIDEQNKITDAKAKGQISQGWMNLFGNGLQTGIGMLASNIGNKKSNPNNPPSTTITTTPNTTTTSSYIQPKLTTNTWTPNTTLSTTLGQYSIPSTDPNKFWNK